MLRIGLFGLGRWGTNILNTLKGIEGVEVVAHDAVTSPNPSLVRRGTTLHGVIVATPGSTHAKVALPFIKAGIPTYIEKPMTTLVKDALVLEKAVKKSRGILFVGHIHRYNPAYLVAKQHAQLAGKLRYLYFEGTNNGPFRDDMSAMWDWASHDVYLAMDLMGGKVPTHVQAWGLEVLRPRKASQRRGRGLPPLYDFSVIKMTFSKGLTAISTTSWLLPVKQKKVTIIGEKDSIIFDEAQAKKVIVYRGMGPNVTSLEQGDLPAGRQGRGGVLKQEPKLVYPTYDTKSPLRVELEEFIRCIREKRQPLTGINDGVAVVRVLAAAEKSMNLDGRKVRV